MKVASLRVSGPGCPKWATAREEGTSFCKEEVPLKRRTTAVLRPLGLMTLIKHGPNGYLIEEPWIRVESGLYHNAYLGSHPDYLCLSLPKD